MDPIMLFKQGMLLVVVLFGKKGLYGLLLTPGPRRKKNPVPEKPATIVSSEARS